MCHVGVCHVGMCHVGVYHVGVCHVGVCHVGVCHVGSEGMWERSCARLIAWVLLCARRVSWTTWRRDEGRDRARVRERERKGVRACAAEAPEVCVCARKPKRVSGRARARRVVGARCEGVFPRELLQEERAWYVCARAYARARPAARLRQA